MKKPTKNGITRVKNRVELADQDYRHKLNKKELEFLDKFNAEFIGATFQKTKTKKYSSKNIHKTPKKRKEVYSSNNARNRCVYNKARTSSNLVMVEDASTIDQIAPRQIELEKSLIEDEIIQQIDAKEKAKLS